MSAYNYFIASLYHVPPTHICNNPVFSFMHLYNKFLVRVLEGMKICENVCNQKILQVYDVQLVTLQLRGKVIFLLILVCCHHNPTWTSLCTGERYATYWNAILFSLFVQKIAVKLGSVHSWNILYSSYLWLEVQLLHHFHVHFRYVGERNKFYI